MQTTTEEQQHVTIIRFLLWKEYLIKDENKGLIVTEKGRKRIQKAAKSISMEDIALILIMFCNDEGIKYTEYGVAK